MKELDYFRRALDNAVGEWVCDAIRETGSLNQGTAAMMQRTREHLLAILDILDKGEAAGAAEYDRITKGDKSDA